MKTMPSWNISRGLAAFLLVLVIAVTLNYLARPLNARLDLTEERIHTLSAGTRSLLADLPAPVTLKFYVTRHDAAVPTPERNYAARVEDLLREYQRAAGGRLTLELLDPKPDSEVEDWARRYGVVGRVISPDGTALYLGLVGKSADREAVIPYLDPQMENILEYQVTRLVAAVARPSRPVVGVISSLPVLGGPAPMMNPFMQQPPAAQRPWYAFTDLQQSCEVRELRPPLESIPDDIQALILVQPGRLEDSALYAIDQFLLRGGRLLAFLDPMCAVASMNNPMMGMAGDEPGLDRLLAAWGVSPTAGRLVVDQKAATRVAAPEGGAMENPAILSLMADNFEKHDVVMGGLESLLLPYAGAFHVQAAPGVEVTRLMHSSRNSGLLNVMEARMGGDAVRQALTGDEELAVAVRLQGSFKTAFPEGRPAPASGGPDGAAPAAAPAPDPAFLKESARPGTIILVADADMLHDMATVEEVRIFGRPALQTFNDNIIFLANCAELLAGDASLAGIRSRGKTERPFEVVRTLRERAEKRYLAEEQALLRELETTRQRLGELQARKDEHQQMIQSPEEKAEIDKFLEKELETRRALKTVRVRLREDIERLGRRLKAANILLMPGLVIGTGLVVGALRRRRR